MRRALKGGGKLDIAEILRAVLTMVLYLIIVILFIKIISLVAEKSKTINWISGKILILFTGRGHK
jgi:hypothetical protein